MRRALRAGAGASSPDGVSGVAPLVEVASGGGAGKISAESGGASMAGVATSCSAPASALGVGVRRVRRRRTGVASGCSVTGCAASGSGACSASAISCGASDTSCPSGAAVSPRRSERLRLPLRRRRRLLPWASASPGVPVEMGATASGDAVALEDVLATAASRSGLPVALETPSRSGLAATLGAASRSGLGVAAGAGAPRSRPLRSRRRRDGSGSAAGCRPGPASVA